MNDWTVATVIPLRLNKSIVWTIEDAIHKDCTLPLTCLRDLGVSRTLRVMTPLRYSVGIVYE